MRDRLGSAQSGCGRGMSEERPDGHHQGQYPHRPAQQVTGKREPHKTCVCSPPPTVLVHVSRGRSFAGLAGVVYRGH